MQHSIFSKTPNDATKETMFFGQPVNVMRYDRQRHPIFEALYEKQISFFWRPEEIDLTRDGREFKNSLTDAERHIFTSNLKYQTLLDSIQGRSPSMIFNPIVSIPELEAFVTVWTMFETIHSKSYTHIIRNVYNDPSEVLDDIMVNDAIMERAKSIGEYYDNLHELVMQYNLGMPVNMRELKKRLLLCMVCVNVLEAVRFYVSFACSFAFAERELMEGNAKVIRQIARDEAVHLSATQHIIGIWQRGEDDPEMAELWFDCYEDARRIFVKAVEQERAWAEYLFKDGSMLGLNKDILCSYVEYIANIRAQAIGLPILYPNSTQNPIAWINNWLTSDNVQVAPQETEMSSYLIGQVDANVDADSLGEFEL